MRPLHPAAFASSIGFVLTVATFFGCSSSVDNTATGSASASGVGDVVVRSAYSLNVTNGNAQVFVELLADGPGAECGSVRNNAPSIYVILNADPNGVGGKTFPAGTAPSDTAEISVFPKQGDAGTEIAVTAGSVTFDPSANQTDIKGSLRVTTASGDTLSATFDAPACNSD